MACSVEGLGGAVCTDILDVRLLTCCHMESVCGDPRWELGALRVAWEELSKSPRWPLSA